MNTARINIQQLKPFIVAAFERDDELVENFDPAYSIQTWEEGAAEVLNKIEKEYSGCQIEGVFEGVEAIGYIVYQDNLLISFGININHRSKADLQDFWGLIKYSVGDQFQCVLFSNNTRAIKWLKTCGMDIVCESVTILQTAKN